MKVLLAVDGSPCSKLAVSEVGQRPWPAGTVIHVISVDSPIRLPALPGSPTTFDQIVQQRREEFREHLADAVATLWQIAPNLPVESRLVEGSPKDAILEEASRIGASLIVVGSHGHGPLRRFFLGSVSQYIANNAPCNVLIVRCSPLNCAVPVK